LTVVRERCSKAIQSDGGLGAQCPEFSGGASRRFIMGVKGRRSSPGRGSRVVSVKHLMAALEGIEQESRIIRDALSCIDPEMPVATMKKFKRARVTRNGPIVVICSGRAAACWPKKIHKKAGAIEKARRRATAKR
jgi:hypothetical protein